MTDPTVAAETCVALGAIERQLESFPGRDIALGALTVTRVLPVKGKAHPHMGLQTVTWLLDGELVHFVLMWWNFLARTPREIADARTDWEERRRFGDVTGYSGPRLVAPSLIKFANPNPAS